MNNLFKNGMTFMAMYKIQTRNENIQPNIIP